METGKRMSEGGLSWLVLLGSFIGHFILGVTVWSAGVLHEVFINAFGAEGRSAEVAAISSILIGTYSFAGLVSGILISTYSEWPVTVAGSLLACAGLVSSAFVTSPLQMYITYGGITGIGAGLLLVAILSIIPKHFDRLLQLAMGMACSGLGAGCLAGPPLIRFLDRVYGWRGTMLVLGGVTLHGVAIGLLFWLPSQLNHTNKKYPTKLKPPPQTKTQTCAHYLNLHLLKKANYIFLLINNLLYLVTYTGILVHSVSYAVSLGYNETRSAMLVSVYGISSFVARLMFGMLTQWAKKHLTVTEIYTAVLLLTTIFLFCWPLAQSYLALAAFMGAFGLCTGGWSVTCSLTVTEILGPTLMAAGYSFVMIAEGVGSFIGPALSGWLYDVTQYYPSIFYLCGASTALSAVAMIQPVIHERRKRNNPQTSIKVDTLPTVLGLKNGEDLVCTQKLALDSMIS